MSTLIKKLKLKIKKKKNLNHFGVLESKEVLKQNKPKQNNDVVCQRNTWTTKRASKVKVIAI